MKKMHFFNAFHLIQLVRDRSNSSNSSKIIKIKINVFQATSLAISKTFIKIYFKYKHSLRRAKRYFFFHSKFIHFVQKHVE